MHEIQFERLVQLIRRNPTLARIETMIQERVGGTMHVLLCKDRTIVRMLFDGRAASLSDFCRLVRGTPEGSERCGACRWLMAMRASCLGATEYSCHGGLWAAVAPALVPRKPGDEFIVVATCGFGDADREQGWKAVRGYIQGISVPESTLQEAYNNLTVVPEGSRPLALSIVELAASVVGELSRSVLEQPGQPAVAENTSKKRSDTEAAQAMNDALADARKALSREDAATGSTLVDVVRAVVGHNPALPFTASSVARAARVSPNHFSSLFKKHSGETFSSFLVAQRVRLARELLKDLTLSVNEVALRTGFQDAAYFSRRFKLMTGQSPLECRRTQFGAPEKKNSPATDDIRAFG